MKIKKLKAGHAEILGETLAKFEFFEAGWNPYERFLDTDKVDLLLRKKVDDQIFHREIQVKYGKLYDCGVKWEKKLFDVTSWRFFNPNEFDEYKNRDDFFVAYVLAHDSGYNKDIFIFPIADFHNFLGQAISSGTRKKVYISRFQYDPTKWFLRKQSKFTIVDSTSCIEVTKYRRNFELLD